MDKDQAEKSLAIIRSVIENTRDDLIERNWGVIWMAHSFINFAAAACGAWIDSRNLPVFWYAVPLLAITVVNILVVLIFMSREQGVRSYVEWQLWGIWITFLVFTCIAIIALHIAEIKPSFFAVIFAMNCGISFSMMGLVFYRRFLVIGGLFFVVCIAAAAWPRIEWWLIGVAWWLATFIPGFTAHREHLRREQHEQRARIL
jgi:hypothetical protein